MKVSMWKFWAVIAALVLMIISYIIGDSRTVAIGTANFFHVLSIILFIALVGGGIYWFFSTKK